MEVAQRDTEAVPEETSNSLLGNTRCCFCFPCFGSRRSHTVGLAWWERIRTRQSHSDDQWWSPGVRALKKIREWSEIVAGPRWKTFIRRFNRSRSGGGGGRGGPPRYGKFQYDPLSYSLNFDEGPGQSGDLDDLDDYGGFRDFSTRYASASGLSSVSSTANVDAHKDVAVFA